MQRNIRYWFFTDVNVSEYVAYIKVNAIPLKQGQYLCKSTHHKFKTVFCSRRSCASRIGIQTPCGYRVEWRHSTIHYRGPVRAEWSNPKRRLISSTHELLHRLFYTGLCSVCVLHVLRQPDMEIWKGRPTHDSVSNAYKLVLIHLSDHQLQERIHILSVGPISYK